MENMQSRINTSRELENFRKDIELRYLKKHSLFVLSLIGIIALPVIFMLNTFGFSTHVLFLYAFFFFAILVINLAFFAYEDYFNSIKVAMYINTLGLYALSASLIIDVKSPSLYISIFLVYAIVSLYQDAKVNLLNNIAVFFLGVLAISNNPMIFNLQSQNNISITYIYLFLLVFVFLISIASTVFIKRKAKFIAKLTEIQEIEVRTLDTLFELETLYKGKKAAKSKSYFESINRFSDVFSKDYGMENAIKSKVKVIKDLEQMDIKEVQEKYPNYSIEEVKEIDNLRLNRSRKIRYIAYKIGLLEDFLIPKRDVYSDTRFTTLRHYEDNRHVRIIAFVVLYVLLRLDNPIFSGLSDMEVKEHIMSSELIHLIDADVLNVYLENSEVFDRIFKDIYREEDVK